MDKWNNLSCIRSFCLNQLTVLIFCYIFLPILCSHYCKNQVFYLSILFVMNWLIVIGQVSFGQDKWNFLVYMSLDKSIFVIFPQPCLIAFVCFLAHLSWRLVGELIVYPWSVVCPSASIRPQCLNIFLETAGQIKAKFYMEPPWVGGTKFCLQHLGHMTKMAAMLIYGVRHAHIW